jgi:hypothetical protein
VVKRFQLAIEWSLDSPVEFAVDLPWFIGSVLVGWAGRITSARRHGRFRTSHSCGTRERVLQVRVIG